MDECVCILSASFNKNWLSNFLNFWGHEKIVSISYFLMLLPCFSFDNFEFWTIFSLDVILAIIAMGAAKDEENVI